MTLFAESDADAWYERNKAKIGRGPDPIQMSMIDVGMRPTSVLEVGCANGWRLMKFIEWYQCSAYGVDLSRKAIKDGPRNGWRDWTTPANVKPILTQRGAHDLRWFQPDSFDLLIYGFCLYLSDPKELWMIADEGDRVLRDGGYLIVHDFLPNYSCSRVFEHNKSLRSRKMDHTNLWTCHPGYQLVHRNLYGSGDDRTHVSILRKDMKSAFSPLSLSME